jgi:hypothetical protein
VFHKLPISGRSGVNHAAPRPEHFFTFSRSVLIVVRYFGKSSWGAQMTFGKYAGLKIAGATIAAGMAFAAVQNFRHGDWSRAAGELATGYGTGRIACLYTRRRSESSPNPGLT